VDCEGDVSTRAEESVSVSVSLTSLSLTHYHSRLHTLASRPEDVRGEVVSEPGSPLPGRSLTHTHCLSLTYTGCRLTEDPMPLAARK
jgi:hypothetical protein